MPKFTKRTNRYGCMNGLALFIEKLVFKNCFMMGLVWVEIRVNQSTILEEIMYITHTHTNTHTYKQIHISYIPLQDLNTPLVYFTIQIKNHQQFLKARLFYT